MPDLAVPTKIDETIALDWLRYSLGQGGVISHSAIKFVEEREGASGTPLMKAEPLIA